jgi:UDP-glucose 4-epimerase
MGISKAMMEKLVRSEMHMMDCITSVTRYGNVIGSRGSVIPQFIESIRKHNRVVITAPKMTRFMMSLDESVELVLFALQNGKPGDLFVQKSPSATVATIVEALSLILEPKNLEVVVAGPRPGEKIHETLLSAEEGMLAVEHEKYFQVPNLNGRDDIKNFSPSLIGEDYTSASTTILNAVDLAKMLLSIPQINELLQVVK